jgi:hypothetical protein
MHNARIDHAKRGLSREAMTVTVESAFANSQNRRVVSNGQSGSGVGFDQILKASAKTRDAVVACFVESGERLGHKFASFI